MINGVAHKELIHDTARYMNNRAEPSHQPARVRERGCDVLNPFNKHSIF